MKYLKLIAVLILAVALLFGGWRLHRWIKSEDRHEKSVSPPTQLVPFRTPGGMLHANGFTKTETFRSQTDSWRGTTTSAISLNAT